MSDRPAITLGDVLRDASLKLTPVIPGNPSAPVRGAHTTEIHDPGRWFEPDTVMLTTGLRFVGAESDAQSASKLIDELRNAGVAALFFGIGVYFEEVPSVLVAACRSAKFPLYTVGSDVPFYHVENFINQSRVSPDTYHLKRAIWLTNDLLQSIASDTPIRALVGRLAVACRGTAVLFEDAGRIVEVIGDGPTHLIWRALQEDNGGTDLLEIGRWHVMARPIVLRGESFILALASRNSGVMAELGELLLETAQRLLGAIGGMSYMGISRERHENAQLLTVLQDGIPTAREYRYWERMRGFRFVPYERLRAVVAVAIDEYKPLPSALLSSLFELAAASGLGLLLAENSRGPDPPAGLHALTSDSSVLSAWLELLSEALVIGLSEPFSDLAATPEAFRDAETAVSIAKRRARASLKANSPTRRFVVYLDEVDPATWLLARRDSPRTEDKLDRFVRPIRPDHDLLETLIAYLARAQDVAEVARALFVHSNTVRYRLKKIEELLGVSLNDASAVTNLYLALHDEVTALEGGDLD